MRQLVSMYPEALTGRSGPLRSYGYGKDIRMEPPLRFPQEYRISKSGMRAHYDMTWLQPEMANYSPIRCATYQMSIIGSSVCIWDTWSGTRVLVWQEKMQL